MAEADRERFAALFDELSPNVYAYACRHVGAADAYDVVADTFLVAWRRRGDVPEHALPWLLVVARNTISNRRRHDRRQGQLIDTAAVLDRLAGPAVGADQSVVERMALLEALTELSELEREAVLLVAWHSLSNRDAARVAGCSQRAFEVRLSRGRARLSRALQDAPRPSRSIERNGR
jgi:RNA polymerase sigma-70 factor (ECF subfamily)